MKSRERYLELKLDAIISVLHEQMSELDTLTNQKPPEIEEILLRQKLMRQILNAMKTIDETYGDNVDCNNDCDYASVRAGECECFNRKQDEIESRCPV